jgi:formylglycine-generating enzyme required for sulfatase activity
LLSTPIPPRIVGRYAVYGEIGVGGMAVVRFGKLLGSAGFTRRVAVKCLHPHYARDPEFRKMFIDEARIASRIAHPNVVSTLDVVSSDGELFMVMEYVPGESLARLRSTVSRTGGRIPVSIALGIVQMVLFGLHAAHEAKSAAGEPLDIVHRDVSPGNVMVGTDGVARVLDFGIARAAVRVEATREGRIKGKLAYMAPEQLGGAQVSRRADIYSVSVMLWELLTGRRLFEGGDPHAALVEKLFRGPVDPPSLHCAEVSEGVDAVLRRGLERDPLRRFATAREMAIAIELVGEVAGAGEIARWVEHIAHESIHTRALEITRWETTAVKRPESQAEGTPLTQPSSEVSPAPGRPVPATSASDVATALTDRNAPRIETPQAFETRASRASLPFFQEQRQARRWRGSTVVALSLPLFAFVVGSWLRSHHTGTSVFTSASPSISLTSGRGNSGVGESAGLRTECPPGAVHIPAARLMMGSDDDSPLTRPAHSVTLRSYCIDMREVTVAEYKQCTDHGDCRRPTTTNEGAVSDRERRTLDLTCNARDPVGRASHPMNCVDWEMASGYCRAKGLRLPTEAEWELAARGPDASRYPWGDEEPALGRLNACGKECVDWAKRGQLREAGALGSVDLGAMYALEDGYATTAPVGSFVDGRSRYGIDDMAGNVAEWVSDYFAPYVRDAQADPTGPISGGERVVRGGAWNTRSAAMARSTFRDHVSPQTRSNAVGFRCAASLAVTP